ncbi:lectin-like protein [Polyangium aurulentum]|uniref:lectin-like protein n=1 Tax=Polyangium aurulentum TaxID=2567896 RepID=UPI0010AE4F27|nr:lectin-like protein [Polyangium aurulentum]UQA58850.1 DUF4215 domain-containing protein [Polyangium aurulentum]
MLGSSSFARFARLLGLVSLPALVPLACTLQTGGTNDGTSPTVTAGSGGSGGMGGAGPSTGGSGGAGPSAGGSGGAGGAGGMGGAGGGVMAVCGNGMIEPGEDCDDANTVVGDGCTGCLACNGTGDFLDPKTWHCYTYVTATDKSWYDAHTDCLARGGDLAGISTPSELDHIIKNTNSDVWIGANDQALECVFVWSNGEPWYPYWEDGEPNDYFNSEECAALIEKSKKFNDSHCTTTRDYLCERVPKGICGDGIVQPSEECDDANTTTGDGCDNCELECADGEIKNSDNLHCYRIVTGNAKSWTEAKNACVNANDGSYLATVTSPKEAEFLGLHLNANTWIGGQRSNSASSWNWVNGEDFCWKNWGSDPDFGEHCIESLADGKWNNTECDQIRDYVCERSILGN